MGAHDGGAGGSGVAAADGVVEEEDPVGARDVIEKQTLDFRVIDLLDVRVRREVVGAAGDVGDGGETMNVEIEGGFIATDVVDGDFVRVLAIVALRARGGFFYVVPRLRAVGRRSIKGEGRRDVPAGDGEVGSGPKLGGGGGLRRGSHDRGEYTLFA